jgi:hypothetical protein
MPKTHCAYPNLSSLALAWLAAAQRKIYNAPLRSADRLEQNSGYAQQYFPSPVFILFLRKLTRPRVSLRSSSSRRGPLVQDLDVSWCWL